jgi:hypothetical protein
MRETPRPAIQDDPPDYEALAAAVLRLREIFNDPDRSKADKRRAVDALGRALLRIKERLI